MCTCNIGTIHPSIHHGILVVGVGSLWPLDDQENVCGGEWRGMFSDIFMMWHTFVLVEFKTIGMFNNFQR
jgi:hypothetical protein